MRVRIEHSQTKSEPAKATGFFAAFKAPSPTFPLWAVEITIELTEEERFILDDQDLWDKVLYVQKLDPEYFASMTAEDRRYIGHITEIEQKISDFIADEPPFKIMFWNSISAKKFTHELETEILPRLKALITSGSKPLQSKTIDL